MKTLGLADNEVRLVEHNTAWAGDFSKEKEIVLDKLGSFILKIEHCGSTSIPNIPSKPIMNICVQVGTLGNLKSIEEKLKEIGYEHKPESNFGDHELFFKKDEDGEVTHHLHFMSKDGENWNKAILFRNYLLENPETAKEYRDLKLKLSQDFPNDRKAYGHGKGYFIKSILVKIG